MILVAEKIGVQGSVVAEAVPAAKRGVFDLALSGVGDIMGSWNFLGTIVIVVLIGVILYTFRD